MASNPIQMIRPERVRSTTPRSELMLHRFGLALVDKIFPFRRKSASHDKQRRISKVEYLHAFL